ncbi:MAG: hypothetical protein HY678_11985 [Chloroflexi bacterium]|nr:hypothetical protein [Chloroflexota bacterium]
MPETAGDQPRSPRPVSTDMLRAVIRGIREAFRGPALLWEEFLVGTVPPAKGLDGRREKVISSQAGDIHKRFVLWARAERLPRGQIMLETGLSHAAVGKIITEARRKTAYFRQCQWVMKIRTGIRGNTVRYLCRYCGLSYVAEFDANQCGWDHVFAPRPLDNPGGRLFRRIDSRVPSARPATPPPRSRGRR